MPYLARLAVILSLLCSAAPSLAEPATRPADQATPLFDGESLEGWIAIPHIDPREIIAMPEEERRARLDAWMQEARQHWKAEDGELVNDGKGPYLATKEQFEDFELTLDYRITPGTDSGVYLRGGPQVQIWDPENPEQHKYGNEKGSGGLWNNPEGWPGKDPLVRADNPAGEWNSLRIIMVGSRVSVWLNDRLVVDHALMDNFFDRGKPMFRKGPIVLQTHGGETRWRNIEIRRIGRDEANQWLREAGEASSFIPLFNGRDLTGWKGATQAAVIEDGILIPADGTVFTEQKWGDFAVRMEFRVPAGGNNGLAIRYPGHGDPAFEGMCELQVLDDESYEGSLRPPQFHGSPYGMVGAIRGFLRPAGQWNYQEVLVRGSTIRVELNGNVIVDCDLADGSKDLEQAILPLDRFRGRNLKEGHFGLAGHGAQVAFRTIELMPLD